MTGASRGIGASVASILATEGHCVVASARSETGLVRVCDEIARTGGDAVHRVADVTDVDGFEEVVQEVTQTIGPIEIFVSAAGVNPIFKAAVDISPNEFDTIFAVNVRAAFFGATAILRSMITHGRGGSIVMIASVGAVVPVPMNAPYCMSKASLSHFARVLALEAAKHEVRVNVVSPGFVTTELTQRLVADPRRRAELEAAIPAGRLGGRDDVAHAVAYLVSAASGYVTGTELIVDGGYGLRRAWPH